MATKLLQKRWTYNQLQQALHSGTQASGLLRNCQRCFSRNPPILQSTCTLDNRHRERAISLVDRTTKSDQVTLLRSQKGTSGALMTKRWFSDTKIEEQNEAVVSPTGERAESPGGIPKSNRMNILEKDASESPAFPQTEGNKTALFDSQAAVNEQVDARLSDNIKLEPDDQGVDSVDGEKETTASSTLARTEPDKNELDFLGDEEKIDILAEQETPKVLEAFIQPLLPAESLSLAAYADHSPTLQRLVELGVDLSKVDKKAKIKSALLKMDFDKHIKEKIVLLHHVGVKSGEGLGRFLTINPFVLTEGLEDLETRVQYLRSKKFSDDAITQILIRAPYFLSFSVERVDSKLGFYQKELSLSGDEIRHIITETPQLVTFKIQRVKENIFVLRQQLGFTAHELKELILAKPKVLLTGKEKLIAIFDYLHNHMGIPHKQLLKNPQVFNGRVFKVQERHQFLTLLGRAQYDPTQPGYVSIQRLSKLPDEIFCQDIAKSSLDEFNNFLKTL